MWVSMCIGTYRKTYLHFFYIEMVYERKIALEFSCLH